MSDASDGSGQIPRRAPRASEGGAPVSGALAIVLAVIAVVAGFLILRSISDGGDNALDISGGGDVGSGDVDDATGDDADGDAADGGTTVPTLPTTTTQPAIVTEGAIVIVANANSVGGSASAMTRTLQSVIGFAVVDPVNAAATVGDIDESRIYYDPGVPAAQAVAESLAQQLGGDITVAPMPDTPPTSDGTLGGASVLLMLGNDKAGKTLAELQPDSTETAVVTSPPIAGATETTAAG